MNLHKRKKALPTLPLCLVIIVSIFFALFVANVFKINNFTKSLNKFSTPIGVIFLHQLVWFFLLTFENQLFVFFAQFYRIWRLILKPLSLCNFLSNRGYL